MILTVCLFGLIALTQVPLSDQQRPATQPIFGGYPVYGQYNGQYNGQYRSREYYYWYNNPNGGRARGQVWRQPSDKTIIIVVNPAAPPVGGSGGTGAVEGTIEVDAGDPNGALRRKTATGQLRLSPTARTRIRTNQPIVIHG